MAEDDRVEVAGGKYSFVMLEDGTIDRILRHGEAWPAAEDRIKASNVVLALVQDLVEAREQMRIAGDVMTRIKALVPGWEGYRDIVDALECRLYDSGGMGR